MGGGSGYAFVLVLMLMSDSLHWSCRRLVRGGVGAAIRPMGKILGTFGVVRYQSGNMGLYLRARGYMVFDAGLDDDGEAQRAPAMIVMGHARADADGAEDILDDQRGVVPAQ